MKPCRMTVALIYNSKCKTDKVSLPASGEVLSLKRRGRDKAEGGGRSCNVWHVLHLEQHYHEGESQITSIPECRTGP